MAATTAAPTRVNNNAYVGHDDKCVKRVPASSTFAMRHSDVNGGVFFELPANQPEHIRLWQIRIASLDFDQMDSQTVYVGVQNTAKAWQNSKHMAQPRGFYGMCSSGLKYPYKKGAKAHDGFSGGETVVAAYDGDNNCLRIFCAVPGKDVNGQIIRGNDAASDHLRFTVFLRGKGVAIEVTQCIDVHKSVLTFMGIDAMSCAAVRTSMLKAPCLVFDSERHSERLTVTAKWTVQKTKKGFSGTVLCGSSNDEMVMSTKEAEEQKSAHGCERFRLRFKTVSVEQQNLGGFIVGFVHSPDNVNLNLPLNVLKADDDSDHGGFYVSPGEISHKTMNLTRTAVAGISFPVSGQEWCLEFDFRAGRRVYSLYLRDQANAQWLLAAEMDLVHRAVVPAFSLFEIDDVIQIV